MVGCGSWYVRARWEGVGEEKLGELTLPEGDQIWLKENQSIDPVQMEGWRT
jgi:hypothetical protein